MNETIELILSDPCGQSVFVRIDQVAYLIPSTNKMQVGLISGGRVFHASKFDLMGNVNPLIECFSSHKVMNPQTVDVIKESRRKHQSEES